MIKLKFIQKHHKFRKKYIDTHKAVDFDGKFGFQCWDLVKRYCIDVLGFTPGSYGNAKNGRKNKVTFPDCEFITPGPGNDMRQGDLFLWNTGKYGHIGIVDHADITGYNTREQNAGAGGGDGKGTNAPTEHFRKYDEKLLGFVRRKNI